jgi:hypothetical protein
MGRSELPPSPPPIVRRQGTRAACLSLRAALAFLLFATFLAGQAIGTAAPARAAELPEGFDDYSPPAKTEQLPPEGGQGGGSTGGGTTGGGTTGGGTAGGSTAGGGSTGGAGKLTFQHILGNWCSTTSNYVIGRRQLVVILTSSGSRSTYKVVDFSFSATTVVVHWITGDNRRVNTTFGRFSADGKQMVQLAVNRTYRRCAAPAATPLSYQHVLGSWCDVDSKYIITRTQLTVVFSGGRRVTYKVTRFKFLKDVVEMYWTDSRGKRLRTRFGRYTADRRGMVQLGPDRAYHRC